MTVNVSPIDPSTGNVVVTNADSPGSFTVNFPNPPAGDITWATSDPTIVSLGATSTTNVQDDTIAMSFGSYGKANISAIAQDGSGNLLVARFWIVVLTGSNTVLGAITYTPGAVPSGPVRPGHIIHVVPTPIQPINPPATVTVNSLLAADAQAAAAASSGQ